MRAYTAADEEALRARALLKDWLSQGFITQAQFEQMEPETACDLRRTNIFLRLVLVLFTLLIVGAAVGLFVVVLFSRSDTQIAGTFLLIFAALTYAAAERAVSQFRLYRHGIEEALAACSVGLLCVGMQFTGFSGQPYSATPNPAESVVLIAGAVASLWLWHRFGFIYAPIAAMGFALWMPSYWTSSHTAQHVIVAALFAAGLLAVATTRTRHRLTYQDEEYSVAEALLWLGIYIAINLQLSALSLGFQSNTDFSKPFYWTTWLLTWILPPVILARGLRIKDRCVIFIGATAAVLTLITNKPYLGWERHTWDPMLLGALLVGVALLVRRWLAQNPGEIRHGFTSQRLSAKDKQWMTAGATAFGTLSPHPITPSPHADLDPRFGGGTSGGGGASSDF